jgi:hypothetical protein
MTENKERRFPPIVPRLEGLGWCLWPAGIATLLLAIVTVATGSRGSARAAARESAGAAPAQVRETYIETTEDKAYRFNHGGWIYVHLEGSPHDIGYQHGYLLATEIADTFAVIRLEATHNTRRDWGFFRRAAHQML